MESHKKMTLQDWLDDLCVRFIINLPQEDLSSVARICFQVEEAQWFYEDFIRPLDPTLPSMSLRYFCLKMFQHCPLLASFSTENHIQAFEEFMQYKTRVPVRGAIMLNHEMDSAVLVKGWKKNASWSFPRGKINKDEGDLDCAIREVEEETGFNIRTAGLVPSSEEAFYIDMPIREQQLRLYVFRDIPMDTHFQPRTRKEISKVQWYKLSDLPAFKKKGGNQAPSQDEAALASKANRFYMVAPFLVKLKKWVVQQKKRDFETAAHASAAGSSLAAAQLLPRTAVVTDEAVTEDDARDHTEPPIAPQDGMDAAGVANLEDANRELLRLLKIQAPQTGVRAPPPASPRQSKGESLLALLQAKGRESDTRMPQTPADHVIARAPQPSTPPHHQNNAVKLLDQAAARKPPPQFPIGPDASSNHMAFMRQLVSQQPPLAHPQPSPSAVKNGMLQTKTRFPQASNQPAPSPPANGTKPPLSLNVHHLTPQKSPQRHGHGHNRVDPHSAVQNTTNPTGSVRKRPQFIQATMVETPGLALEGPSQTKPTAPANDKHRTTLLEMFKKTDNEQGAAAANTLPPSGQVGPDSINQASSNQSNSQQPTLPHKTQKNQASSALSTSGDSAKSGQRDLLHMLRPPTRAAARSDHQQQQQQQQPSRQSSHATSAGPAQAGQALAIKSPNIVPSSLNFIYGKNGSGNPSAWASPPAASAFATPGLLGRPQEATSEHKQKLLSLFGNPQQRAVSAAGPEVAASIASANRSQANVKPRVGSISTMVGEESKAKHPISPAEKDFLLEYLTSMTQETKSR